MISGIVQIEQHSGRIVMPGMASAHSHAFQRALRGRTQRRRETTGSFWTWRAQMFRLCKRLSPELIFDLSRFAFVELAMSGVTAVGEFHYVHHDVGGNPYADRLATSEAVIAAARAAGIRITLIRTGYFRAGFEQALVAGQDRFCDPDADAVLRDVDALRSRYAGASDVRVAVAAHSVRACTREQIVALAAYARAHDLPFHMHVSEQRREVDECLAEHARRPLEFLAELGVLDDRLTAVHATHLLPHEIALMGQARVIACICRSTERDLGDGAPDTAGLIGAGARLCVGADSHCEPDVFAELRAIELDARTAAEARWVAADGDALLEAAVRHGHDSIGWGDAIDSARVELRAADASLVGADPAVLADAVVFGATPRAVERVIVAGRTIVDQGEHARYGEALAGFERAMAQLR
jgi:formiminoglutamate deiminase